MRRYQHNVGSHAKLPAGRARNRVARIHVCNAKSIDVRRPSGKVILHKLKENPIETSRVVMLFRRVVDPVGKSNHYCPYGELEIRRPCWPDNPRESRRPL